MFSGGYAPFCVCWLNINFKLICLREHMHFVKILQKGGEKKTCTSSSDLPIRVIVTFFYIVEAYMFHQVCISLSILTFLLDENFALDVHLLSRLFLLFVCFIGVYDTYKNYYFLSLQFLWVWSPKWNHDINCHRAENKPMFSPQHLFQNKIC